MKKTITIEVSHIDGIFRFAAFNQDGKLLYRFFSDRKSFPDGLDCELERLKLYILGAVD